MKGSFGFQVAFLFGHARELPVREPVRKISRLGRPWSAQGRSRRRGRSSPDLQPRADDLARCGMLRMGGSEVSPRVPRLSDHRVCLRAPGVVSWRRCGSWSCCSTGARNPSAGSCARAHFWLESKNSCLCVESGKRCKGPREGKCASMARTLTQPLSSRSGVMRDRTTVPGRARNSFLAQVILTPDLHRSWLTRDPVNATKHAHPSLAVSRVARGLGPPTTPQRNPSDMCVRPRGLPVPSHLLFGQRALNARLRVQVKKPPVDARPRPSPRRCVHGPYSRV